MYGSTVYIQNNVISVILILMNHSNNLLFYFFYLFKILMVIWQQNRDSDPFKTAVSWFFTYVLLLICSAHRSDFLLYRKSCMLTGKMSDIRRNRLFSLSCSDSVYSMFSHVSSLHSSLSFLTFICIASSFLFRNIFI